MLANDSTGQRPDPSSERRLDEFALLVQTADELAAQHDVPALLQVIVERARQLAAPTDAAVLLHDPPRGELVLVAVTSGRVPLGTRMKVGEGLTGHAASTRRPMIVNDYPSSEYYVERFRALNIGSAMMVPMLLGGELIGVLGMSATVEQARRYDEADVRLLSLFAIQAAGAVRSAQLLQESRERANQLAESEARLRRLVDANIVGIVTADADGRMREANDAYLRLIGYTRRELESGAIHWRALMPPEHEPAMGRALAHALHGGSSTHETEYLRKDGSRVPVLIGTAVFNDGQETVAFALDLSERRRADAEHHARVAAEAASRAKSTFLANMSHELRTPLNAILGFAQILQLDRTISARAALGVGTIRSAGEHLLMLINDILDLSRIEAGKLELRAERADLGVLLQEVADTIRVKAEEKGLRFDLCRAGGLPRAVQVDELRLRQILLNLLSNAVKFTDCGEVGLHAGMAGGRLRFEVRDTGIGIADSDLRAIFEPFEQVAEAPRRLGGSGLGLAISRQLVRAMGGELEVATQPGTGSAFWFELALPVVEPARHAPPERRRPLGYAGTRRKVLVVDDTQDNRTMLGELLESLGFDVEHAHDGTQALARAPAAPPDLILLDIVMPGLDGLEVARRMRRLAPLTEVPIVLVSASSAGLNAHQCREVGADAFLRKPIDVDRLLDTMGGLMGLVWMEAETNTEPG